VQFAVQDRNDDECTKNARTIGVTYLFEGIASPPDVNAAVADSIIVEASNQEWVATFEVLRTV
jgi:hypothetical protein